MATLVATDLVGSTALVSQVGDERAAAIFRRHDEVVRGLLKAHGGRELERTDGFISMFRRPIDGARFALALHRALAALGQELGVELRARAGVHMGECVMVPVVGGTKEVEAEGLTRIIAARIMGLAQGGQTLLTRSAFDLARRAAVGSDSVPESCRWMAHGPYHLKGIGETMEVFEAGLEGESPLSPPPDTEKAQRALVPGEEAVLGWRPAPGIEIPGRRNWSLDSKLGEGGFGEVWLARQEKTGELRVFKFCFDSQRLRSLKREVALFRILREKLGDRDDIARILEWQFDEAPYFLESEHTASGNLNQWMQSRGGLGRSPLAERLSIVSQAARALAAAHGAGVLHKDIKPSNILIRSTPTGAPRVQLTDFGIGMLADPAILAGGGITATGLTTMGGDSTSSGAGTRMYQSPEALEGKPADARSDIYVLGIILFQVVCGDLTRALAPGWERAVPDSYLRSYIARCCDHDPAARYESADDLAEDLEAFEATANTIEKREFVRESVRFGAIAAPPAFLLAMGWLMFWGALGEEHPLVAAWILANVLTVLFFVVGVVLQRLIFNDIEGVVLRRLCRRSHLVSEATQAARQAATRYAWAAIGFPLGLGLAAYIVGRPREARKAWKRPFEEIGREPTPRWALVASCLVGGFAILSLAGLVHTLIVLDFENEVYLPRRLKALWALVIPLLPGVAMLFYLGARCLFGRDWSREQEWARLFPGTVAVTVASIVLMWAPASVVLNLDARAFPSGPAESYWEARRFAWNFEGFAGDPAKAELVEPDERPLLAGAEPIRVLCIVPGPPDSRRVFLRLHGVEDAEPLPLERVGRNSKGDVHALDLPWTPSRFWLGEVGEDGGFRLEPGRSRPRDLRSDPLLVRTDDGQVVYLGYWAD